MAPSVLAGIGAFFLLFIEMGLLSYNIVVFVIGLTLSGLSFCLYGILEWRRLRSKRFRLEPRFLFTGVLFFMGVFELYSAVDPLKDVAYFLSKDYKTITGIPSNIAPIDPSERRGFADMAMVTIQGEKFDLPLKPGDTADKLKNHTLVIRYLPNSKWIVEYQTR